MLVVSATSSNSTLVPNANIVLGGTGTDRTIAITPAAGQSGTTTITVTVSDGISTSSDTFQLIVDPVGGLVDPVITITSGNKVYDGTGYVPTTTVGGSAGDVTNPALTYTYFVGTGTGGTNLGATAPIDVGTYTVVASFAGNASYNPGTAQKTFDITPATVTVASATASNKVYDTTTAATVTAIVLNGVIARRGQCLCRRGWRLCRQERWDWQDGQRHEHCPRREPERSTTFSLETQRLPPQTLRLHR